MTNTTPPNWHPDPYGRHEMRYWDGATWTEHVANAGVTGVDKVAPAPKSAKGAEPPEVEVPRLLADLRSELAVSTAWRDRPRPVEALERLAAIGTVGTPMLMDEIERTRSQASNAVERSLGVALIDVVKSVEDPGAVPYFMFVLADLTLDDAYAKSVARALGKTSAGVHALESAIRNHADATVRVRALSGLLNANKEPTAITGGLEAALADVDASVRMKAISTITTRYVAAQAGRLDLPTPVTSRMAELIQQMAASDPSNEVRAKATAAISS